MSEVAVRSNGPRVHDAGEVLGEFRFNGREQKELGCDPDNDKRRRHRDAVNRETLQPLLEVIAPRPEDEMLEAKEGKGDGHRRGAHERHIGYPNLTEARKQMREESAESSVEQVREERVASSHHEEADDLSLGEHAAERSEGAARLYLKGRILDQLERMDAGIRRRGVGRSGFWQDGQNMASIQV